ncbi:MAG: multidrug effflux MFS transporter [Planktomarina sp.]
MSLLPASKLLDRTTPPHIITLIALPAIGALAMNIFLPSLSSMATTFRVDYALILLAVTLFLGSNAILQLFIGPLSDRFGRRQITLWSIALFCVATIGTIMATNYWVFMTFRTAQGVIVAGMVLSRAALRDMYNPNQAASMLGFVTMGMAMIPMVGPAIGGILQAQFGWISNFWFLLASGSAVFALTYFDMGETNQHKSSTLSAQFAGIPELLISRRFWGYSLAGTFGAGSYFAYLGGAAFVGATVFKLSPEVLGFYFGSPAIGYICGNFLSGLYSQRFGLNTMILAGSVITLAGLLLSIALFVITVPVPLSFFGCIVLMGVGNGLTMPNSMAGILSVRPHLAGSASGIGGTLITGGGAILASVSGALLTPGTGALTLLVVMTASTIGSLLAILYVMRVDKVAN